MCFLLCGALIGAISTSAIGGKAMTDSEIVQGNNRFALDLHARLASQPGNLFVSPASLSIALAMTYSGARGETAAEMAKVLHFPATNANVHAALAAFHKDLRDAGTASGCRLSLANRLWGQKGSEFLPEFLAITRESYGAELGQVDFAQETEKAREQINTWVLEQTEGKIKDLIPPRVLTNLTRLVLTNAIYFKGNWSKPFSRSATHDDLFHVTSDKTTQVPLMSRQDDLRYWAGEGVKVLEIPYGKGDLTAVVLLPDEIDGLPALEANTTVENLGRWLAGLRDRKVQVFLPRFRLSSQFSLRDLLTAMGMKRAFSPDEADFSGMSTHEQLYLSAVIHKAFVDVNEEGTEAAAATGVAVAVRAAMVLSQPAVFRADHPFLFLIRDRNSGSILFLGRVVNPNG
jgi:serpin B